MRKNHELVPMSAQERKEDIDMLMDLEMMDATVGGGCSSCDTCSSGCSRGCSSTCQEACSNNAKSNNGNGNGSGNGSKKQQFVVGD